MAYTDLDSIHTPTAGAVAPHTWGAAVNADFDDVDARTNISSAATANTGTTTSTTFTATLSGSPGTNPAVTVTTGTIAIIDIATSLNNSGANGTYLAVAVSGATTRAASNDEAILVVGTTEMRFGVRIVMTGLTAGANTFTLQYRVDAGTGTFRRRALSVHPGNKLS